MCVTNGLPSPQDVVRNDARLVRARRVNAMSSEAGTSGKRGCVRKVDLMYSPSVETLRSFDATQTSAEHR